MGDMTPPLRPNSASQFRSGTMSAEENKRIREYYFGSCGPNQSFYPKRHRWGRWKTLTTKTGARFKERICLNCSLASDPKWEQS